MNVKSLNAVSTARAHRGPIEPASPGAVRLAWLLAMMASVGYLCRVDITNAAPQLVAEFHLTPVQIGTLASAFMLGYTAFQVPSGWLAERVSVRGLFLAVMLGWVVLTAAVTLVSRRSFGSVAAALFALYALRFLYGVFSAPTYPGAGHAIATSVPRRLHGRANSAVLASIGVGNAIAVPLLATISLHRGWRAAMLSAAAIAAAGAAIWRAFAPRAASTRVGAAVEPAGTLAGEKSPLRQRSFWFLCSSYFLEGYLGYVFVFWLYLYLIQARHFEQLNAAWITSVPWLLTLLVIPLSGWVSDWAVARWGPTWGHRLIPVPAMLISAVLFVVVGRTASAWVAAGAFTLATPIVLASEPAYWASMNRLSGRRSGIGGGMLNFFGNLGGVVSPRLTPWMAQRWGWTAALCWTAVVSVAAALLWFGVREKDSNE